MYIGDTSNDRVRKVATNGVITTVAGNGAITYVGDLGAATNAGLYLPYGVAVDAAGDLFIADSGHDSIRKVDANGFITTVAGDGNPGYTGDGGPATSATLQAPYAVALNAAGNLYIADSGNNAIREVTLAGSYPYLVLNDISPGMAGTYQVLVTSPSGSTISSNIVVNVVFPPGLASQPISATVLSGSNASFIVSATGTGPLSCQWQFDGTNLADGGEFSGSATTNLVVSPATGADAGLYDVIITNAWGSVTSSVASLNIAYSPAITSPPASLEVINGGNASFNVTATGTGPLAYQWQFDGTNLTDGVEVNGSATTNLVLTGINSANGGIYDVVVSSVWGSVTSSVATLAIAYPPGIAVQPAGQTVVNGSNAVFGVTATGTAPLAYQWQLAGTNLTDGGNITGSATASLALAGVNTNNAGLYDVIISSAWGGVTSSVASLTVVFPATIVAQPAGVTASAGSNTGFAVEAAGTAPLYYQWQFNGTNLTDGGQLSGSATDDLRVTKITTNNAGNYRVIVTNAWGNVTSFLAALTIAVPPVITNQPGNVASLPGVNATMTVGAYGSAPLFYHWQFNGTNLPAQGNPQDVTATTILFDPVRTNNAGPYDVVVSNYWGSATSSIATLTVLLPPIITNQPASLTLTNATSAAFSVGVGGQGPFTYQWVFNGKLITNNIITTVAGKTVAGYSGDGGPATNALLDIPQALTLDAAGNLYIVDAGNQRVRKVNASGIIATVAGNGGRGYGGNGLTATNTTLYLNQQNPVSSAAVDASGNLFIADTINNRVRVETYGILITAAGNGAYGHSGDGGPAYNAELNEPAGVVVDPAGNIYFSDSLNQRIRKVAVNDVITTVAGTGTNGFSGDGGAATNANLNEPEGLALDSLGNLYIADTANARIRMVNTNGVITTIAGKGATGYSGDGGAATNANLYQPAGVAVDTHGNLYIADTSNDRVRMVNASKIITTVAGSGYVQAQTIGDGGAATNASLEYPTSVAVDGAGNLYIADSGNDRIRKVTPQGPVLTLANLTTNNIGNYQVIVANAGGSVTSSVASLSLVFSPAITVQPVSQTVIGGAAASFSAAATGAAPLFWQWQFNGQSLAGQTNQNLVLTGVSAANAGAYQATVTNVSGAATSGVATLAVTLPQISPGGAVNGGVALNLLTAPGLTSRLLAATNLAPPVIWLPIGTNLPGTNGLWYYTDTNAGPMRFYRTATP